MPRLSHFRALLGMAALFIAPVSAQMSAPNSARVQHVIVRGTDDAMEVEIQTSGAPVAPDTQAITGPDRIVVDFPGALPAVELRALKVNREGRSLRTLFRQPSDYAGRARSRRAPVLSDFDDSEYGRRKIEPAKTGFDQHRRSRPGARSAAGAHRKISECIARRRLEWCEYERRQRETLNRCFQYDARAVSSHR